MRALLVMTFVALNGCGDDPVDPDRTAEATAKIASCAATSAETFAALSLPLLRDEDLRCALDADGCAETLACFGWRLAPRDCSMPDTCVDDDTLATCRGMLPIEIDCGAWYGNQGPLCVAGATEARCGVAMCPVDINQCDGTIRRDCSDGVEQRLDCANLGQACAVIGTDADCTNPTSTACSGEGRCEGDVLVACEAGFEHRLDCPGFVTGSTCLGAPGDGFCGFATECSPSITSPSDACTGTSLGFCFLGRIATVDCTSIGFAGCTTDALGTGCR